MRVFPSSQLNRLFGTHTIYHARAVGLVAVLTGLPFAFQLIDYNLEPDNSSDHAGDVIFGRILDGFVKLTGFTPKSR